MSLFDDLSRFLESRLDEFLKDHPDLELQALDEQLRQQEEDTRRLLEQSKLEETQIERKILTLAEEVKTWHLRVQKAVRANRPDLAAQAKDREAALLSQGNQLWGQMKGLKDRITQMQTLLGQIQVRRNQVKEQIQALKAKQAQPQTEQWSGWTKPADRWDALEQEFQKLEIDQEMERIRQKRS